jgi:hypothetical protein
MTEGKNIVLDSIEDSFTVTCQGQVTDTDLLNNLSDSELNNILTKYKFRVYQCDKTEKVELIRILRSGAKVGPVIQKKLSTDVESVWSSDPMVIVLYIAAIVSMIIFILAFIYC